MPVERLIVFVKAPRPGEVKTRLAAGIGATAACAAYRKMVAALLTNLAGLPDVELRFSPDDAGDEIKPWLRPGWRARPQGGGDLGARMIRACEEAFAAGAERVVVIGSDCPEVELNDVREAWRALKTSDLAVGPATDGGYWLIGLRRSQPQLFAGIRWSSDQALADTLQCAKAGALRIHLLRILSDVDTQQDWQDYLARQGG